MLEQGFTVANFHHLAQVHHQHPVAHVAHHIQVVADEHIGQAKVLFQIQQQIEHLRFHRLVQGRNRLVQDDQARLQGQGAGNVDALALTARQLVRVALGKPFRRQTHAGQQVARAFHRFALGHAMHHGRKRDRVFHGQARVERCVTVLKHHLRLAPIGFERQGRAPHGLAIKNHLTLVGGNQLHEQTRGGGFAATRLAHHAQGLAFEHIKVHPVNSTHHAAAFAEHVFFQWEMFDQATHTEHGLGRSAHIDRGQRHGALTV